MSTLSKGQVAKLAEIVAATNTGAGMCFMTEKSVKLLVDAGYVECNIGMTDPADENKVAVRATQTGLEYGSVPPSNEGTNAVDNSQFTIESNVAIPTIKRGGGSATSIYPFAQLEIGQSFFVKATEDMPNPGKSLASTVSSASKRYATPNGTRTVNRRNKETGEMEAHAVTNYDYDRKFMVRTVEETDAASGEVMKGARVWRVAVHAETDQEAAA